MKVTILALAALLIAACASHTGIISMGRDTYMIAKQQATGFPGLGNMKAQIISEGSQYCAMQGKEFQLLSAKETEPPYVFGNYPRSEIHFACHPNDDPAFDPRNPSTSVPSNKLTQK